VKNTLNKLSKSIRLKAWLANHPTDEENNNDYNPKLYLPSHWKPPEASSTIEECLENFELAVRNEIAQGTATKGNKKTNLTKLQIKCLKTFVSDRRFMICLSDKNLGPVIMERSTYFKHCLADHLLCKDTYVQLTEEEATKQVQRTRTMLLQLRLNHRNDLTEAENAYFRRNANLKHRLPQFYITIKVHKQPYKLVAF
jgi:hypothetical protein